MLLLYNNERIKMKKKIVNVFLMFLLVPFFVGCATDGGPNNIGDRGQESTLSNNNVQGMYLFKIETNQQQYSISARDVKIGM